METELKFKIESITGTKDKLKKLGAKKVSSEFEQDFYFDNDKKTLWKTVKVLRIRKVGRRGILTMKSGFKKVSKKFKVMRELEVNTDNFQNLKIILGEIGYKVDGYKEKYRDTYRLDNVNILIDRLPYLGSYMELEGRGPDINRVVKKLGFDFKDSSSLSYGQLFSKYCSENIKGYRRHKKRVVFSFDCERWLKNRKRPPLVINSDKT